MSRLGVMTLDTGLGDLEPFLSLFAGWSTCSTWSLNLGLLTSICIFRFTHFIPSTTLVALVSTRKDIIVVHGSTCRLLPRYFSALVPPYSKCSHHLREYASMNSSNFSSISIFWGERRDTRPVAHWLSGPAYAFRVHVLRHSVISIPF